MGLAFFQIEREQRKNKPKQVEVKQEIKTVEPKAKKSKPKQAE